MYLTLKPANFYNTEKHVKCTLIFKVNYVCCVFITDFGLGLGDIENTKLRLLQQNYCDYCHDIALEYFTIKTGVSIIIHVCH